MKRNILAFVIALMLGNLTVAAQTGSVLGWGGVMLPIVQPGTKFTKIVAGAYHSLALESDGTVLAWGDNDAGQSSVPAGLNGVVAIAAGEDHSLALESDGTILAWGDNDAGQISVPAGLNGVVAIAGGAEHSLALKKDGTVVAWGYDGDGESTVPTGLNGVVAIAAGWVHSLALKSDGTVVAWGNNYDGQSSVPGGLNGVVAISAGVWHSLALKSDGTVVAWGDSSVPAGLSNVVAVSAGYDYSLALKSDGTVVAWGGDLPAGLNGVVAISTGLGGHSLALKNDGTIVAWGDNSYGEGTVPIDLNSVVAISAGWNNNLALISDGTVVAWGPNFANVPAGLNGVVAIAAGQRDSLALKNDGTVVAWGANLDGESTVPANLNGVVAISAGELFSLALKSDGTVVAWGDNYADQSTVPVGLNGVVAIATGEDHSLALKNDGTVVAWGDNIDGEATVPAGLNGVVAIAAGESYSLALRSDGTVVAWGDNSYGESTVPVNLSGVVAIAAGGYYHSHSLALKNDGTVVAWGDNSYGESTVPADLTGVAAIAAGGDYNLALVAAPTHIQIPFIINQPVSRTAQAGASATFSVVAEGPQPLDYQWQLNGQNMAGQTAASLSLADVQFANAGGYSVVVANAYGSVSSAVAQLTVSANLVVTQVTRTPPASAIGSPTIPTDPNHFKILSTGPMDPSKNTIVLTHGWNGSPSDWAEYMAQIVQQRIGVNAVNIVAWDWSADAQSDFLHLTDIAAKTPGEGTALGTDLIATLGASYSQRIHFVGHSLGTLVNATAANYVHTHGFSPVNTQMTLCDEAEIAWGVGANGLWQFTTTLPGTLVRLIQNASSTEPYWGQALPNQFAWADNYISACGLLHPEAANAILNFTYPSPVGDMNTFLQEFYNFHDYAHYFYEDTIEPGIFNTGGQINPTFMGFICSFEGGGAAGRPAANTYFYQDPNGLELNLAQTDFASATSILNSRLANYWSTGISSAEDASPLYWLAINSAQAFGQVSGIDSTAGIIINLETSFSGGDSQIRSFNPRPMGGPMPQGGSNENTPAFAWIPLTVPSNAVSMSFDFMLQGNGNQDSFQAAIDGTNILSLETVLIQTNVTENSGLIDVSPYAGQQTELFLGIVGGTSTNAALTASNFQFYSVLPPSLQIQIAGTNVVLTCPVSATGYLLQTTTNLTTPQSWTIVTNVPSIIDFQYMFTNQMCGGTRFYRLSQTN